MESKEKVAAEIVHFNREISRSVSELEESIRKFESYRAVFDGQRNLLSRLELLKRIFKAAINHAEQLRPRMFMIEEQEEEVPQKAVKGRKSSSKTKNN